MACISDYGDLSFDVFLFGYAAADSQSFTLVYFIPVLSIG